MERLICIAVMFTYVAYGQCWEANPVIEKFINHPSTKTYETIAVYDTAHKQCWKHYVRPYQETLMNDLKDFNERLELFNAGDHSVFMQKKLQEIKTILHQDSLNLQKQIKNSEYCKRACFSNKKDEQAYVKKEKNHYLQQFDDQFEELPSIITSKAYCSLFKDSLEVILLQDEGWIFVFGHGENIIGQIKKKSVKVLGTIYSRGLVNTLEVMDDNPECAEFREKGYLIFWSLFHIRNWTFEKSEDRRAEGPPKEAKIIAQQVLDEIFKKQ